MAIFKVPVVKGKGVIEVDSDKIDEKVYVAALAAGLKVLLNAGTSKITKAEYPDEAELKAAAMTKAEERAAQMVDGTLKLPGQKASSGKATGKVMTEALRLAKAHVKDLMREQGIKVSHVDAKEITAAAKLVLEQKPELIAEAEENLKVREAKTSELKIDLSSIIKINPAKKAKADADAAAKKANKPLSAKQAGMTKKGRKAPAAHAH